MIRRVFAFIFVAAFLVGSINIASAQGKGIVIDRGESFIGASFGVGTGWGISYGADVEYMLTTRPQISVRTIIGSFSAKHVSDEIEKSEYYLPILVEANYLFKPHIFNGGICAPMFHIGLGTSPFGENLMSSGSKQKTAWPIIVNLGVELITASVHFLDGTPFKIGLDYYEFGIPTSEEAFGNLAFSVKFMAF